MSDPARLLETNLDSTFRRALDAAITAEPPQGEQSKIWQSIALALPSGVLLGATTSASAAALSGAATSAAIGGAATSAAVSGAATSAAVSGAATSAAVSGAATSAAVSGAATSTAIGGSAVTGVTAASTIGGAAASAAIGSSISAAAGSGIASASATVGAVGGGLGLVAAKAVAVGLGLGLLVNTTVVSVPKLFHVSSGASAQVAPEVVPVPQVSPRRAKPQSPSYAPFTIEPAPLPPALSTADAFPAKPQLAESQSAIRTSSESATSPPASLSVSNSTSTSASAAPGATSDDLRLESAAKKNGASADGASADGSSPSADDLRDESRLLARARQALNASNSALAIELISEHRRVFPAGRLVQERDALEVQALQRSARYSEARARARAFLVHFPMSPHREKIRAIAE